MGNCLKSSTADDVSLLGAASTIHHSSSTSGPNPPSGAGGGGGGLGLGDSGGGLDDPNNGGFATAQVSVCSFILEVMYLNSVNLIRYVHGGAVVTTCVKMRRF